MKMPNIKNTVTIARSMVRYNLKIVFAGKFKYFFAGALAVFIILVLMNLLDKDASLTDAQMYRYFLIPGILLIFYPITFGLQNDIDNRMIEILYGIPNYRYKVWLLRLALIFLFTFGLLLFLTLFSRFLLVPVPVVKMMYHIITPIVFTGCVAFLLSTLIRDGSGTAVVLLILALLVWFSRGFFEMYPRWDLLLNPFDQPTDVSEAVWGDVILANRFYLLAASVFTVLFGLLNLQKREHSLG